YERLFVTPNKYHFEFFDYTLRRYREVFIAIGRERGKLFDANGDALNLEIRTTRIFHLTNERWRQIHHHGSIDDPAMLASYQDAVLKRADRKESHEPAGDIH